MSDLVMYDAIDVSQIPAGPPAVAGYVDGKWPTAAALDARFPHAHLLTIAVSAAHDAECLDIETGDATPADAPGWFRRQQARGVQRPCLYASVSLMQSGVLPVLKAAGITRAQVRIWTAHYAGLHICGPSTCGEMSFDADGTQWTDTAFGRDLDQSALVASFFTVPAAPVAKPAPKPATEDDEMPSGLIQAPKGTRQPVSWLGGTVSQVVLRADWQGIQDAAPAVSLRIARTNGTWADAGTITVGVNEVYTIPDPATCNGCSFTREDDGAAEVAYHLNPA